MANDLSIQWVKRGDEWRQHYLSQSGMYFSFDEAYRSETGKDVPVHLYISQGKNESIGRDVRDSARAEQILVALYRRRRQEPIA